MMNSQLSWLFLFSPEFGATFASLLLFFFVFFKQFVLLIFLLFPLPRLQEEAEAQDHQRAHQKDVVAFEEDPEDPEDEQAKAD